MKTGQIIGIGNLPVRKSIFVVIAPRFTPGEGDDYFLAQDSIQFTLSGHFLEVGDKYLAETVGGELITLSDYGVIVNDYSGTRSFYDEESAKEYAKSLATKPIPDWMMDQIDLSHDELTMERHHVDHYAKVTDQEVVEVTLQ